MELDRIKAKLEENSKAVHDLYKERDNLIKEYESELVVHLRVERLLGQYSWQVGGSRGNLFLYVKIDKIPKIFDMAWEHSPLQIYPNIFLRIDDGMLSIEFRSAAKILDFIKAWELIIDPTDLQAEVNRVLNNIQAMEDILAIFK